MSYDGFYSELSTRASANQILAAVEEARDQTLDAEANVEVLAQQVSADTAAANGAAGAASVSAADAEAAALVATNAVVDVAADVAAAEAAAVAADASADAAAISAAAVPDLYNNTNAAKGSALIGHLPIGTGAEGRFVRDKLEASCTLVTDYMTVAERADALTGTPALNHSGAFTDFIAAVITKGGRGRIPKGTYKLDTNVIGDWTQVIEYEEGAVLTGVGILFAVQHIQNKAVGTKETRRGLPDASSGAVTRYYSTTDIGDGASYGVRFDYRQTTQATHGFSLGIGNICQWDDINGGAGESMWAVATTPTDASGGTWGVVVEEQNIVNRGPDNGYVKTRGEKARWCGAIQVVPEATDLSGGTGLTGRNAAFGYCTASSSFLNNLGFKVKFYNGLLVEKDSIGPDGRGALFSGDSSGVGSQLPKYGVEIDQRWAQGLNTTAATFTGNIAINMADNQVVTWGAAGTGPRVIGSQTSGLLSLASTGSGAIQMVPGNSGVAMQFAPVASAVNLWSVNGNTAGASPQLVVAGADPDITAIIASKGAGNVQINVGNLAVNTVGKGVRIKEGANAKMGVSTLVAGSVVVANTSVTATSRIQLTGQSDGGTPGWLRVSARTAGTSFTITSSSGTDTSVVAWELTEPA